MTSKEQFLRELLKSTNMSESEISKRMNRSESTLRVGVKYGLSLNVTKDLSELTGQNMNWLASGDGKWN